MENSTQEGMMEELRKMLIEMAEQIREKVLDLGMDDINVSIGYGSGTDVGYFSVTEEKDGKTIWHERACRVYGSKSVRGFRWENTADEMNEFERREDDATVAS